MKRFLLMTVALLCFVGLSGRNKKNELPFKTDSQKGLYVGVTSAKNFLTGQQEALAMALTAFVVDIPVDNQEKSFSSSRKFNCDIRVVDIKFVDDQVYTLFKISLEGNYNVMVSNKGRSVQYEDTFFSGTEHLIKLTLENQSNDSYLEWGWRAVYTIDGTNESSSFGGTVSAHYEDKAAKQ